MSDIVAGTILAEEWIDDGTAVNLGTMERTRVIDAMHEVTRIANYSPQIELLPHMPTGPLNRVAANDQAKRLLGSEPKTMFKDGLARALSWRTPPPTTRRRSARSSREDSPSDRRREMLHSACQVQM